MVLPIYFLSKFSFIRYLKEIFKVSNLINFFIKESNLTNQKRNQY